jgi:hypothetical protein
VLVRTIFTAVTGVLFLAAGFTAMNEAYGDGPRMAFMWFGFAMLGLTLLIGSARADVRG